MTDRERLVKLLCEAECKGEENQFTCPERRSGQCRSIKKLEMCQVNNLVDNILSDGWIRPPYKVGDTVWAYCATFFVVLPYLVGNFQIAYMGEEESNCLHWEAASYDTETDELIDVIDFDLDDIGKMVFLTREEAEQALAERQDTQCEQ